MRGFVRQIAGQLVEYCTEENHEINRCWIRIGCVHDRNCDLALDVGHLHEGSCTLRPAGHGTAAGRSSGDARNVPWILARPKVWIVVGHTQGDFMRIGLSDDLSTSFFDFLNDKGIFIGNTIRKKL